MSHDKIIEDTPELERRLHARRASDRYRDGDGLARERRYELLHAAAVIRMHVEGFFPLPTKRAVDLAEDLLAEIESRERERQQAGHEAWLERSETERKESK